MASTRKSARLLQTNNHNTTPRTPSKPSKTSSHPIWGTEIRDIIRQTVPQDNIVQRSPSEKTTLTLKVTFAEDGSRSTRSKYTHQRRATSPSPFSGTASITQSNKGISAETLSTILLQRPLKRRRLDSPESAQESARKMAATKASSSKILVINPNTSTEMTEGLAGLARDMSAVQGGSSVQIELFTASKGPASIDNELHAMESARVVIEDLVVSGKLGSYHGFLVACYSVHPLVGFIRGELEKIGLRAHVMGIFEASILTALSLLPPGGRGGRFGIVSTGKYWEKALGDGVKNFLGSGEEENSRFAAVSTTGLNADQLHSMPKEKVRDRMKAAVKSLMDANGDVEVIILGCAGMAGLEGLVREALMEKYGDKVGKSVFILDGVRCGIGMLENLIKTVPL